MGQVAFFSCLREGNTLVLRVGGGGCKLALISLPAVRVVPGGSAAPYWQVPWLWLAQQCDYLHLSCLNFWSYACSFLKRGSCRGSLGVEV